MMANTQRILAAARRLSARGPFRALSGSPAPITRCAFIGLGNMGAPMAHNLVRSGLDVAVYDARGDDAPALRALVAAGARAAPSAGAAAAEADAVVTMLPDGRAAEEVYLGPSGLLASAPPGALLVDCSTGAPASARRIAAASAALARPGGFIDAPVSGGTAGAEAGTLTFIVGADDEAVLARAREGLLARMGASIEHAGGAGAGQVAKICNNLLLGIMMAGTSEALRLGAAHGVAPEALSRIMLASSGNNWVLQKYNPAPGVMESAPASRGYAGGFAVEHMAKDLGLAQSAAAEAPGGGAPVAIPLGAATGALYAAHRAGRGAGKDFSSIIAIYDDAEP